EDLWSALLGIGTIWGVGLVAAAALLARRLRLAAVITLGGASAWVVARIVGSLVSGSGLGGALPDLFSGAERGSDPVVPLAVLGAVIMTAAPFLSRPVRRLNMVLVVLLAVGAMYDGSGTANDVFGALLVAWGVAAAVHLAFGSPAGRPTALQVTAALAQLGL